VGLCDREDRCRPARIFRQSLRPALRSFSPALRFGSRACSRAHRERAPSCRSGSSRPLPAVLPPDPFALFFGAGDSGRPVRPVLRRRSDGCLPSRGKRPVPESRLSQTIGSSHATPAVASLLLSSRSRRPRVPGGSPRGMAGNSAPEDGNRRSCRLRGLREICPSPPGCAPEGEGILPVRDGAAVGNAVVIACSSMPETSRASEAPIAGSGFLARMPPECPQDV
jgi:hypothetical protein